MKLLINWIISAIILFLLSEYTSLLKIADFTTALKLAVVMSFIIFLLRVLSGFLKVMGCLTFGLSYLAGLILSMLAMPIALIKAMPYVKGYTITGYDKAVVVSILLTLLSMMILDTKKSSG